MTLQIKIGGKKSKDAGLAQQNGLGLAFLHSLLKLVRCTSRPNTCC
jgi:hypothetical protein